MVHKILVKDVDNFWLRCTKMVQEPLPYKRVLTFSAGTPCKVFLKFLAFDISKTAC